MMEVRVTSEWDTSGTYGQFYDGSEADQRLRYEWDLWSIVVDKLLENGTLVPKHVAVDI